MGEISFELYKWLTQLEVLPNNQRYNNSGNFILDSKVHDALLSGYTIAKLLIALIKQYQLQLNQAVINSIKNSNTQAARLYNWTILHETFHKIGINLNKSTQASIVAGNFEYLVQFLLTVQKKMTSKKNETKISQSPVQSIDIQSYPENQKILEIVIEGISKQFKLTAKQAVATLSERAKYLAHIVVKGWKNSFQEVINLFQLLQSEISNLMLLCETNPSQNLSFLIEILKPTLLSRDAGVALQGAKTWSAFINESLRHNEKNIVYQILCKQEMSFEFLVLGLKRHPNLAEQYFQFIYPLTQQAFKYFLSVELKKILKNQIQYLKIIILLLPSIVKLPQSKNNVKKSQMIAFWINICETSFKNKPKTVQQTIQVEQLKSLSLQLLCDLWKAYEGQLSEFQTEELLLKGVQQLKKNTRKQVYTLKISALCRLFDFLDYLASNRNKLAALIYKKIIFLFVENHGQGDIRQVILDNMVLTINKFPTVPLQLLAQPFLKQLTAKEGISYFLNLYDFQFMIELCRHPNLELTNAISFLDYFCQLYNKLLVYSTLILRLINLICTRFCQNQAIAANCIINVQHSLNLYGILVLGKKKKSKQEIIINNQKKSIIIELIKLFIRLENEHLNEKIIRVVIQLYSKWKNQRSYADKGLQHIMSMFGDPEEVYEQFMVDINSNQQYSQYSRSKKTTQSPIKNYQFDDVELSPLEFKKIGKGQMVQENQFKMRRKGNKSMENKNLLKVNSRVLEDLDKLKLKVHDKQKQKERRNKVENKALGYAKIQTLQQGQMIFEYDSFKVKYLKEDNHFIDINSQEKRDIQSTFHILQYYNKVIKTLFNTYAHASASENNTSQNQKGISFTQLIRMLNEKNMNKLPKVLINELVTWVNFNKRKERNVLGWIEWTEFNNFLIAFTDSYVQYEKVWKDTPFGGKLQKIVRQLIEDQSYSKHLFSPMINKMKLKLNSAENPQSIKIPQGYKLNKENTMQLKYTIQNTSQTGISQAFISCYEVMDYIVQDALKINIVDPWVEIKPTYTIVSTFKIPKIQQSNTENNMKPNVQNEFITKKGIKRNKSSSQRVMNEAIRPQKQQGSISLQKSKAIKKRQEYEQDLNNRLKKLKQKQSLQKQIKIEKSKVEQKMKQNKEKRRLQYLEENKRKLKENKQKEENQKAKNKQEQLEKNNKHIAEIRKNAQYFLEKEKKAIESKKEEGLKKKNQQENENISGKNKFKPIKGKDIVKSKEKIKDEEVKESLKSGELKLVVEEYEIKLKQLFQGYWEWNQQCIQLKSLALLLKDFHISPQYISPPTIVQTYRIITQGQKMNLTIFNEFLVRLAYKSQKLSNEIERIDSKQGKINKFILIELFNKLQMNVSNYKAIINKVKTHI